MRKWIYVMLTLLCCSSAWAQKADLRKGNRQFRKGQYAEADISYRKGLMQDTSSVAAHYNLANNLYRQENYDEAWKQLEAVQMTAGEEPFAADYYFNSGDVAAAREDWQSAVNMFKEALRRNPADVAAKENYIYARNKLMEQQQQQQQLQDQDQNQDQDQQNQQNQQDQKDQDKEQNQNQDQKDQQQNQQDQNQGRQPQPQEAQLSRQQAQQLLQAIQDKEKQTQEKVDAQKAQALKSRQKEKNW